MFQKIEDLEKSSKAWQQVETITKKYFQVHLPACREAWVINSFKILEIKDFKGNALKKSPLTFLRLTT
jgi:hypothetical protein